MYVNFMYDDINIIIINIIIRITLLLVIYRIFLNAWHQLFMVKPPKSRITLRLHER